MVPIGLDPGLGVFFVDLTVKAIDPSLEYDNNGDMARGGYIDEKLQQQFLKHPYYLQRELSIAIGVGPLTTSPRVCGKNGDCSARLWGSPTLIF